MKTKVRFGKAILLGAVIGTAAMFAACSNDSDTEDTTDGEPVVEQDTIDVVDEPVDTFTISDDLLDTIPADITEEDITE